MASVIALKEKHRKGKKSKVKGTKGNEFNMQLS